jgi:hypothetical protein
MPMKKLGSFVALIALTAACSDTPGDKNNSGADMGASDMRVGLDMRQDMPAGGTKAAGEPCADNAECASASCLATLKQCAEAAGGELCGALTCASDEACEGNVCARFCPGSPAAPLCETDAGGVCCGAEQACLFAACVDLGAVCDATTPCPRGQFCEPTVGRCVDRNADPNACVYVPPAESFDPIEGFAWTVGTSTPASDQVMMSPMVANLTDDNGDDKIDLADIPDIVFVTFAGSAYTLDGVLRVISGADGAEQWDSSSLAVPFVVHGSTIPALADIDGDGVVEIIVSAATSAGGGVYALEHDGQIKWHNKDATGLGAGGPSVANLDGAGAPEILTLRHVLSADGQIICALPTSSNVPVAADLDGDGVMEIIHGSAIYKLTNPDARDGSGCTPARDGGAGGGFVAVADLDDEPEPELVHVVGGKVLLLEADGTTKWERTLPLDMPRVTALYNITDCTLPVPTVGQACTTQAECGPPNGQCAGGRCRAHGACSPGGGPPTVADFDGDGEAEIGIAGRWYYLVYEQDGSVLWAHSTKDFSSAVTGSSVFDFEGDGRAEVVYNDEEFLRVYRGAGSGKDEDGDGFNDPVILFETQNTSGTLFEYPLVVDVDNDGNAEIVVAANNYSSAASGSMTKGIRVFRDAKDNWVTTRRIWNQHAYHVTNIEEDGSVPLTERPSWSTPGLNNYRQNVQGDGLFNAPNLTIAKLEVDATSCGAGQATIRVTITNAGSLGVRAGTVTTTVWGGSPERVIASVTNTRDLPPGASETLVIPWAVPADQAGKTSSFRAEVDRDAMGEQRHNECREEDNAALQPDVICALPQ